MNLLRKNKKVKIALVSAVLIAAIACGTVVSMRPIQTNQTEIIEDEPVLSPSLTWWEIPFLYPQISDWWYLASIALTYPEFRASDFDRDGLVGEQEYFFCTNPLFPDTDFDGMYDGYEVIANFEGGWQESIYPNERYAVLLGGNPDLAWFWLDLCDMYDLLIEDYGYKKENVIVLYGDGGPPTGEFIRDDQLQYISEESIETHRDMIDGPSSRNTVIWALAMLSQVVTSDDSVFFYYSGHGGPGIQCSGFSLMEGGYLYDFELYTLFSEYSCAQLTFCIDCCHSGGFLDPSIVQDQGGSVLGPSTGLEPLPGDSDDRPNLNDLADDPEKRIIVMTSQDNRDGHTWNDRGFSQRLIDALKPLSPTSLRDLSAEYEPGRFTGNSPDVWQNHMISMKEAFVYARDNNDMSAENAWRWAPQEMLSKYDDLPMYWESFYSLGDRTYL
ncbi:MAG: caspase family protein [Candidatus Lokiarchaeota archaeon]|nr:caspase family protein [Candidatus Lokiarchaeota archaeon]